jgi:hypothetical protein
MTTYDRSFEGILTDLESQGLSVKTHDELNHIWFVNGEGVFLGHVATSDELIELKRSNNLNLLAIKSLA